MGARHYCPKIPQVPGTFGTHANSSPVLTLEVKIKKTNCSTTCMWEKIVQNKD
jgi:hypothetical protein